MHESMKRLYEAALALCKTEGQTNVAVLLNEYPQTLNNWETRGISAPGAIKAERLIGCRAAWVYEGHGDIVGSVLPDGTDDARLSDMRRALSHTAVELGLKFDHLKPLSRIKFWNRMDEALFEEGIETAEIIHSSGEKQENNNDSMTKV